MNVELWTIILSFIPVFELRGSIPYAIVNGLQPWVAFGWSMIGNLLAIPITFIFLDYLHVHFMKIRYYEKLFNMYANRLSNSFSNIKEKKWPYAALCAFVAVPFPGTGAYSGVLLAWLFGMKRIRSYLAIILGVVAAGVIVTLFGDIVINFIKSLT